MSMEPGRAASAMFGLWKLEATKVMCDQCTRPARFQTFTGGLDEYLCYQHTQNRIKDALESLDLVAHGA